MVEKGIVPERRDRIRLEWRWTPESKDTLGMRGRGGGDTGDLTISFKKYRTQAVVRPTFSKGPDT